MGVLDGKAAIVTGSARGIGRATAELLVSQGARVLINDLDSDVAAQAGEEIDGETAVFAGDLTKPGVPDELIAKEWGQFKVNVNAVAFGFIDTRLTQAKVDENVMQKDGETIQLGIPEQMRQMASVLIPLGRPATPAEAAGGIFFLCSPWSNYVHGQTLHVTGGIFGGMSG